MLLPARGLRASFPEEGHGFLTRFARALSTAPALSLGVREFLGPALPPDPPTVRRVLEGLGDQVVHILDSVHENGPKLVRMSDSAADALANSTSGVRPILVKYYSPAFSPRRKPASTPPGAMSSASVTLRITTSAATPTSGLKVVVYTNVAADEGDAGITDADGRVLLRLGGDPATVESMYVEAPAYGFWDLYRRNSTLSDGQSVVLSPILPTYQDCVRSRCSPFERQEGDGVRVAVIDTGIGPHPDLVVADGRNTVTGEPRSEIADNGMGHGTHVAGIVCGRPSAGFPLGIAPAAELWSGRVYAAGSDRATNYSIMKAMILATEARCDLLNLSLAADEDDDVLQEAVADAAAAGSVVFAATGNDGQPRVAYPARSPDAVAVTAFGSVGTFPGESSYSSEIGSPQHGDLFFASFANHGPEVRFIGPGVGVMSASLHGGGYAIRSGTSMACAAVTGMAARLLARSPDILAAARDRSRSVAIQNMLADRATRLGFGFEYEGSGTLP